MKRLGLLLVLLIFYQNSTAQYIGFQPINERKLEGWIPKFIIEYAGVYKFGDSEAESVLLLTCSPSGWVAQIRRSVYDTVIHQFVGDYQNLSQVDILPDGRFISNEYSGRFMRYRQDTNYSSCLKIYNSWSEIYDKDEYELGCRISTAKTYLNGMYPQASYRLLDPEELCTLSALELALMRNEIFARYGYIFRAKGTMDQHFRKQSWYQPQHARVDDFLTTLERKNIETIRALEDKQ